MNTLLSQDRQHGLVQLAAVGTTALHHNEQQQYDFSQTFSLFCSLHIRSCRHTFASDAEGVCYSMCALLRMLFQAALPVDEEH